MITFNLTALRDQQFKGLICFISRLNKSLLLGIKYMSKQQKFANIYAQIKPCCHQCPTHETVLGPSRADRERLPWSQSN